MYPDSISDSKKDIYPSVGNENTPLLRNLIARFDIVLNKLSVLMEENRHLKSEVTNMSKKLALLEDYKAQELTELKMWVQIKGITCCSHNDAADFLGYKPASLSNKKKDLGLENAFTISRKVYYTKESVTKAKDMITTARKDSFL